jgi:hypothetical protein
MRRRGAAKRVEGGAARKTQALLGTDECYSQLSAILT